MGIDFTEIPTVYIQLGLTLIGFILFFIGRKVIKRNVKKRASIYNFEPTRIYYTTRVFNFLWIMLFLTVISLVWNVSFRGLSLYFASIFTVIGVATVAQWSILSNITAGMILFFNQPYSVGNYIKIIDGENSVIGTIEDIRPFNFRIRTDNDEVVFYPNNLLIQKPVKELHRSGDKTEE